MEKFWNTTEGIGGTNEEMATTIESSFRTIREVEDWIWIWFLSCPDADCCKNQIFFGLLNMIRA